MSSVMLLSRTMKNPKNMSLKELLALDAVVHSALDVARQREATKLQEEFQARASALGLTARGLRRTKPVGTITHLNGPRAKFGLVGKRSGPKFGAKVAVKYRHPKDKTLTWTGRGRTVKWLADEIKKGRKLASFLVTAQRAKK